MQTANSLSFLRSHNTN